MLKQPYHWRTFIASLLPHNQPIHPTLVTSLPFAIAFKQNILRHFELIENSGIPNTLNTISNYTSQTGSGPWLRLRLLQRANVGWGHQYTRNCNGLTTCAAYPYTRYTVAVMVMAKWFPVQAECAAAATTEGGPTRLGDWEGGGLVGRVVYGGVICSSTDTNIDDVN